MIRAAKQPAQPTRPDYSDPIRGPGHLATFAGNAAAAYQGSKSRRIVSRLHRSNQLRPVALGDDAPQNPALPAIVIAMGAVHRGAVVDHEHIARPPFVRIDN